VARDICSKAGVKTPGGGSGGSGGGSGDARPAKRVKADKAAASAAAAAAVAKLQRLQMVTETAKFAGKTVECVEAARCRARAYFLPSLSFAALSS